MRAQDQRWCCNQRWDEWASPLPESWRGSQISPGTPQPLLAHQASSEAQVLFFWGGSGRSCAQARSNQLFTCASKGLVLPQHRALGFPFCFTGRDQFSSQLITSTSRALPGIQQVILKASPLRQITGGWTWHLMMTCRYFDWTLILLAPFNASQVFQLSEVILWISSPGCA